jgi:DNA mismatch endonuclease, patch repair protein
MNSPWKGVYPDARAWKRVAGVSPAAEQDAAVGERDRRVVPLADGRIALGSIALRVFPHSRRIRAYLRWSDKGRTRERYLGEVDGTDRMDNLRSAWALASAQGATAPGLPPGRSGGKKPWASSIGVTAAMRGNRSRDTRPELALRSHLHALGLRYRVAARPIPSIRRTADVVFTGAHVAVFVDGCYWHGCAEHHRPAKRNIEFWTEKIDQNRKRDAETDQLLEQAGWTVVRVWEHEDPLLAAQRIQQAVRPKSAVIL